MQIDPSARLYYRLMDDNDAGLLFELDQDAEVMKYINGGVPSTEADIQQRMLPRMNAYRDPAKGYGLYAVFTRAAQTLTDGATLPADSYIGWVLVRPMYFFTTGAVPADLELGWRFKRCVWRQGYASEAAAAVCAAAAQLPGVTHLSAIALPDNSGSVAVMKKLGMQFVRRYLHRDPLGDFDVVHYSMAVR
jgi:RimJ/RimL family protein N-acetyltransferase